VVSFELFCWEVELDVLGEVAFAAAGNRSFFCFEQGLDTDFAAVFQHILMIL
jgi:hypothetical protein